MLWAEFAVQQGGGEANPWTGPAILAGLLGAVGLFLTFIRDHLQRKVKIGIKPVIKFSDNGIGDMEVFITNEGYRPFTLVSASVQSTGSTAWEVYSEMTKLGPGESVRFGMENFMAWVNSEFLIVDIAPGRAKRVQLPHQHRKIEREAKRLVREIEARAGPFSFFENKAGIWFGNKKCGVALDPRILAIAGNEEIGRTTTVDRDLPDRDETIDAIIEHLYTSHPTLFEAVRDFDRKRILCWKREIVARFR